MRASLGGLVANLSRGIEVRKGAVERTDIVAAAKESRKKRGYSDAFAKARESYLDESPAKKAAKESRKINITENEISVVGLLDAGYGTAREGDFLIVTGEGSRPVDAFVTPLEEIEREAEIERDADDGSLFGS